MSDDFEELRKYERIMCSSTEITDRIEARLREAEEETKRLKGYVLPGSWKKRALDAEARLREVEEKKNYWRQACRDLEARVAELEQKLERQDVVSMQDEEDLNTYRARVAELEQDLESTKGSLEGAEQENERLRAALKRISKEETHYEDVRAFARQALDYDGTS